MEFRIKVKTSDEREWWENYDRDVVDPHKWSKQIIESFNNSLKPYEKPRELLEVEILSRSNIKHHRWAKMTGGMSVRFRGSTVDLMKCDGCGITGKTYGLNPKVTIDSKYRKKAFRECNTARIERFK